MASKSSYHSTYQGLEKRSAGLKKGLAMKGAIYSLIAILRRG